MGRRRRKRERDVFLTLFYEDGKFTTPEERIEIVSDPRRSMILVLPWNKCFEFDVCTNFLFVWHSWKRRGDGKCGISLKGSAIAEKFFGKHFAAHYPSFICLFKVDTLPYK